MQYTLFVILAPVAALIMLVTLVYTFQHRKVSGAIPLVAYLASVTGFLLSNMLELADPTQAGTLFWAKFDYIFIVSIPVTWLAFTMDYTGHKRWLSPDRFWVFCVVPILTVVFALTTEMHGLIWESYRFTPIGSYLAIEVEHGIWFWIFGVYNYALLISGGFLVIWEFYFGEYPTLYRHRSLWLIAGVLMPLIFNLIYLFHLIPAWKKDYTPLAFAMAGLCFAIALFRYNLLDLVPMARGLIVDHFPDGVLLLDDHRRILDLNPAARGILEIVDDPIGKPIELVWPQSREFLNFPGDSRLDSGRLDVLTRPDVMRLERRSFHLAFSIRVTPVAVGRKFGNRNPQGWMILLSDVTRRVEAEKALGETNRALEEANAALRQLNEDLEARIQARTIALTERAAELEALSRVSSALRQAVGLEELLNVLLQETIFNVKADAGAIFLLEGEELVLNAGYGLGKMEVGTRIRRDETPIWRVVETGKMIRLSGPMIYPQTNPDGKSVFERLSAGWRGLSMVAFRAPHSPGRSTGSLALSARTLGVLVLCFGSEPRTDPSEMTMEDIDRLMKAIAEIGSNALQRVRTMENLESLVQSRTRQLSTLYEITTVINQFMNLPDLLEGVLKTILEVLGLRAVTLHLLDEKDALHLAACVGLPPKTAQTLPAPEDPTSPWQQALFRGSMVVLPEITSPVSYQDLLLSACIGVPVRAKGRQLGVLSVLDENIGHFSAEDIALLGAIADHVGVGVESAQLRQKAEDAAVMEERQRLARDLHDSVTQSLYSLVLFSEAVKEALSAENSNQATVYLDRLREAGQQALKEMRLLIYELRPLALQRDGLVGALRNRLDMVEQRAGVEVHIEVERLFPLPDSVETGLFGIAQEALNNVLKHARASRVDVYLCGAGPDGPRSISMEIRDNGVGFAVDQLAQSEGKESHGVGLNSMRERARQLGGALTIQSIPGKGTSIIVTLPEVEEAL